MWRCGAVRVLRGGRDGSPRAASGSAAAQLRRRLESELEDIRGAGTWKSERVIASRQGPHLRLAGGGAGAYGGAAGKGSRLLPLPRAAPEILSLRLPAGILNFCANNYLGLSSHPEVIRAAVEALEKFGAGLSSVRFICGTQVPGSGAASPG